MKTERHSSGWAIQVGSFFQGPDNNHQANNCSRVQSNGFTSIQAVALAERNDQDWWNGER